MEWYNVLDEQRYSEALVFIEEHSDGHFWVDCLQSIAIALFIAKAKIT